MPNQLFEQNDTLRDILYQCADVISEEQFKETAREVASGSLKLLPIIQNKLLKETIKEGCIPRIHDAIFCDGVLGVLDSMELAEKMECE